MKDKLSKYIKYVTDSSSVSPGDAESYSVLPGEDYQMKDKFSKYIKPVESSSVSPEDDLQKKSSLREAIGTIVASSYSVSPSSYSGLSIDVYQITKIKEQLENLQNRFSCLECLRLLDNDFYFQKLLSYVAEKVSENYISQEDIIKMIFSNNIEKWTRFYVNRYKFTVEQFQMFLSVFRLTKKQFLDFLQNDQ